MLNLINKDHNMKKTILSSIFISIIFLGYSQNEISYPNEGLKLNYDLLYFTRNDTVFSCIIYKDNRADSIDYFPIKDIKKNYIFLDSVDVNFNKIINRQVEFVMCEPSIRFIQIKEIVRGEYECFFSGPYVITFEDGSTRIINFVRDKQPDELIGSIKKSLLLR